MAGEQKKAFIIDVIREMQALVDITDRVAELDNEYFDSGYNGGGGDALVQADLDTHDMTLAEFTSCITLMQQLNNFVSNSAVTTGDYAATLNAARRAPNI